MIITHNGTILTNDGVVLNNIITSPSFQNTYSLDFDGTDDYVDVGEIPPLFKYYPIGTAKDNPWSASMWVKGTSGSFLQLPYTQINSLYSGGFAFAFTGTYLYFGGRNIGIKIRESEPFAGGSTAFNAAAWNHIVMTFDGVDYTALSSYKLYVNGVLISTELIPANITDWRIKSISIGGPLVPWLGNIDEVSLFDTELSDVNVSNIYNGGTPTDLTSLNPIAWYRMGDNGAYKSPQWLIPNNENKDKVSNYSTAFDGLDDSVEVGSQSLGITGAISVSAWVKIPTTNTGGGGTNIQIVACEDVTSTGRNWLMYWRGGGQDYFSFGVYHTDGSSTGINSTGIVPNDGEWHHLLGTYDGTTSVNGLKLFVDGSVFQTTAVSSGVRSVTGVEPTIGSLSRGLNWFFEGNIDEVSIWDNVVSIGNIWNGSGSPIDITPTNPFAYWKMGENATFVYNVNPDGTWLIPDEVGSNDGTSNNLMADSARVGEAPGSVNNALSFNMDLIDRVEDTPPTP